MELINVLVETVVCSGAPGKEARFKRMLEVRQEFKRRQDLVASPLGLDFLLTGQGLYPWYTPSIEDKKSWKRISQQIARSTGFEGWRVSKALLGDRLWLECLNSPLASLEIPSLGNKTRREIPNALWCRIMYVIRHWHESGLDFTVQTTHVPLCRAVRRFPSLLVRLMRQYYAFISTQSRGGARDIMARIYSCSRLSNMKECEESKSN